MFGGFKGIPEDTLCFREPRMSQGSSREPQRGLRAFRGDLEDLMWIQKEMGMLQELPRGL